MERKKIQYSRVKIIMDDKIEKRLLIDEMSRASVNEEALH